MKYTIPILLVPLLAGCAGLKTRQEISHKKVRRYTIDRPAKITKPAEVTSVDLVPTPVPVTVEVTAPPAKILSAEKPRIPVVYNEKVEKWINYFTVKDRARFQRFLDRGERYKEVVESVLEENDMPAELYYLAMIESGYRIEALSHAKARGVWQFIPGTADRYGLRIDRDVDERQDPIRSTEAAAKYLRDLYNVFGSWHLAMAGYNAGEIRVLRAVFKGKSRDFWKLAKAKALPSETADYVPKFLAVVIIGQNPQKYGFTISNTNGRFPGVETVEVPGSLSLSEIAKASNISLATLRSVNPHLKNRVPAGNRYELWVPTEQSAKMTNASSRLAKLAATKPRRKPAAKTGKSPVHVVRRGENLSTIARRNNMSVGHLKRINNLSSNRLYAGTKLRLTAKTYKPSKTVRYIVKRGDNLTFIANKFKTTIKKVQARNKLKKNTIMVGQVLHIDPSRR